MGKKIMWAIICIVVIACGYLIAYRIWGREIQSLYISEYNQMTVEELIEAGIMSEDFWFSLDFNPENQVFTYCGFGYVNNLLLINAEPNALRTTFEELAKELNAEIISFRAGNVFGDRYTFRFDDVFTYEELHEKIIALEKLDFIERARLEILFSPSVDNTSIINNSRWANNWGLEAVYAHIAWDYSVIMNDARVLVLDSGFYHYHRMLDLLPNPPNGVFEGGAPVRPYHGTHVAGIVSAMVPSSNAFLYTVQILHYRDDGSRGFIFNTFTQLMNLIELYVRDFGVNVINFSMSMDPLIEFAAYSENEVARTAIDNRSRDFEEYFLELIYIEPRFVFITSAGNQYERNPDLAGLRYVRDRNAVFGFRQCPDGYLSGMSRIYCPFARIQNPIVREHVIVVGAVEFNSDVNISVEVAVTGQFSRYQIASFSQRGELMDVTAPGVNIYSAHSVTRSWGRERSHNRELSGTSQAAPFVSGLATMIFEINPNLTGAEVRQIIIDTSDTRNHNMINAGEAVRVAIERLNNPQDETNDDSYEDTPDEIPYGNDVNPDEAIEAYMEFLRQRGFERYQPEWPSSDFTSFAFVDIGSMNVGVPELIVTTEGFNGWFDDLIFVYDSYSQEVIFITHNVRWSMLFYSKHPQAYLVFSDIRGGLFNQFLMTQDYVIVEYGRSAANLNEVEFSLIPNNANIISTPEVIEVYTVELSNFMNENGFTILGAELAQLLGMRFLNSDGAAYPGGIPNNYGNQGCDNMVRSFEGNDVIFSVQLVAPANASIFNVTINDTWENINHAFISQGFQLIVDSQRRKVFEKGGFQASIAFPHGVDNVPDTIYISFYSGRIQ